MDDFDLGLLDDKTYMVSVLRQKMLGIAPVFLYRIKKEKAPGQEYLYVSLNSSLCWRCLFEELRNGLFLSTCGILCDTQEDYRKNSSFLSGYSVRLIFESSWPMLTQYDISSTHYQSR